MNNLLYINFDYMQYCNKTMVQLKTFFRLGFKSYLVYENNNMIFLDQYCEERLVHLQCRPIADRNGKKQSVGKVLASVKILDEFINLLQIDCLYIRRLMFKSILFTGFMKRHTNQKIYYEIPTFPFDSHNSAAYNLKQRIEYLYYKKYLIKYVDKTFVICQNNQSLTDSMIPIENGVDIDRFPVPSPINQSQICLIGIAHLQNWHGYDRLMKGIAASVHRDRIHLYIVSEESETVIALRKLVQELGIQKDVTFMNSQSLENIIELVRSCAIGIGGLAYHRRGAVYDTSIKNKEYCAMGLPFVISCEDRSFPDDFKYIYKVKSDESIPDVDAILKWYTSMERNNPDYRKEMYEFAKNNLTYEKYYKFHLRTAACCKERDDER